MDADISYVLEEAESETGIIVLLRMRDDPGPERMKRLIESLRRISEKSDNWTTLDKRLVSALHFFSFHADGLVQAWKNSGIPIRESLYYNELPTVYILIDQIYGN
jgi:hypothetical protein